jgi:hypothetical protein
MLPAEIVERDCKGNHRFVVLQLLREPIRQSRHPSHGHPEVQVEAPTVAPTIAGVFNALTFQRTAFIVAAEKRSSTP